MGLSGDIYFEFKTTSEKTMIMIHSQGANGDFIKVSLIGGNHLQFEYDSGKGPQVSLLSYFDIFKNSLFHTWCIMHFK